MADFFPGAVKTARAHFLTLDNAEADVQGDITFASVPEGAVVFSMPPSGSKTSEFTMGGPAVGVVISAKADADLQDGTDHVRELTIMSEPFNIVAPEAVGGAVSIE